MAKTKTSKVYAVKVGENPGLYYTWKECEAQVLGFPDARHHSFKTVEEARAWLDGTEAPSSASSSESTALKSNNNTKKRRLSDVRDESGWDVVYSDGASKRNGRPDAVAGVGVWWGRDDPRNIAERCPGGPGLQTNNRAELIAISRVLETAPEGKRPLLIKTDSQYCRDCFQDWLPGWIKRNWRTSTGEPVKNAPLIKYLSAQFDIRARRGQKVRLQYVKAHNGEEGNEGADAQANLGVLQPQVDERDWERLEAELKQQMEAESSANRDRPRPVPLEVADDEGGIAVPILRESKMRKTSGGPEHPQLSPTKLVKQPLSPVPAKTASTSASITPQDFQEYANCMLDESDLLAELND